MARLLIAEDDESIRFSLAGVLRGEGYVVDEAANGLEAARLGTRDDYALVILDVEMPGQSGIEACRQIRARHAQTAILMLTGRTSELDTVAGLDAGADDYVAKPFRVAELLARVRAHVRRTASDELCAGEWYGSPKTLDMHVLALRRKLGDPAHIVTVRGIGLRFEP